MKTKSRKRDLVEFAIENYYADTIREKLNEFYERAENDTDSPIERDLLFFLCIVFEDPSEDRVAEVITDRKTLADRDAAEMMLHEFAGHMGSGVFIFPQCTISGHRVDFLVGWHAPHRSEVVVIECDGHDYHERTKEQARKDKSRDRDILSVGFQVMRFTGSEIYGEAGSCADEVFEYLRSGMTGERK